MRYDYETDPLAQYNQTPEAQQEQVDQNIPVATAFGTDLFNAATAAAGRAVLGLGSIATQNASAVTITGGSINGATIGGSTPAAITGTDINATGVYKVGGTQVVTSRQAAVADAAGGATIDAEARTAINALLNRLRIHGLIAP
jgi:hypothetical protein